MVRESTEMERSIGSNPRRQSIPAERQSTRTNRSPKILFHFPHLASDVTPIERESTNIERAPPSIERSSPLTGHYSLSIERSAFSSRTIVAGRQIWNVGLRRLGSNASRSHSERQSPSEWTSCSVYTLRRYATSLS